MARDAGFIYRRTGTSVPVSAAVKHTISQEFALTPVDSEWNGKLIRCRAAPAAHFSGTARQARCKAISTAVMSAKAKRGKHDFAFSGLIACAKYGCSGGRQDQKAALRLVTTAPGMRIKCQGNPASCRRSYVRCQGGYRRSSSRNCLAKTECSTMRC